MHLNRFCNTLPIIAFFWIATANAESMSFKLQSLDICKNCRVILAEGEITESTPLALEHFLEASKIPYQADKSTTVFLNSPGGSVIAGLRLGEIFRRNGFDTHIGLAKSKISQSITKTQGAICASSCAYAFLGGNKRSIEPGARYGLHQISVASDKSSPTQATVSQTQDTLASIIKYIERMGVSADVIKIATLTSSTDIYWVEPSELYHLNVINSKGLMARSSWKMDPVDRRTWKIFDKNDEGKPLIAMLSCAQEWSKTATKLDLTISHQNAQSTFNGYSFVNNVVVGVSSGDRSFSVSNATIHTGSDKSLTLTMQVNTLSELAESPESIKLKPFLDDDDKGIFGESFGPVPTEGLSKAVQALVKRCQL